MRCRIEPQRLPDRSFEAPELEFLLFRACRSRPLESGRAADRPRASICQSRGALEQKLSHASPETDPAAESFRRAPWPALACSVERTECPSRGLRRFVGAPVA